MNRNHALTICFALATWTASPVLAQPYPAKSIRVVVGF